VNKTSYGANISRPGIFPGSWFGNTFSEINFFYMFPKVVIAPLYLCHTNLFLKYQNFYEVCAFKNSWRCNDNWSLEDGNTVNFQTTYVSNIPQALNEGLTCS